MTLLEVRVRYISVECMVFNTIFCFVMATPKAEASGCQQRGRRRPGDGEEDEPPEEPPKPAKKQKGGDRELLCGCCGT